MSGLLKILKPAGILNYNIMIVFYLQEPSSYLDVRLFHVYDHMQNSHSTNLTFYLILTNLLVEIMWLSSFQGFVRWYRSAHSDRCRSCLDGILHVSPTVGRKMVLSVQPAFDAHHP